MHIHVPYFKYSIDTFYFFSLPTLPDANKVPFMGLFAMLLCFSGLAIVTIHLNAALNVLMDELKLSLRYNADSMEYFYLRRFLLMVAVFATICVAIVAVFGDAAMRAGRARKSNDASRSVFDGPVTCGSVSSPSDPKYFNELANDICVDYRRRLHLFPGVDLYLP